MATEKPIISAIVVPLSRGMHALVDESDYQSVSAFKWSVHDNGCGGIYAVRVEDGKRIFMHRWLMGVSDTSVQIDHRDCDSLNNTRSNLRIATNRQNNANRRKLSASTSQYKGVRRRESGGYQARIKVSGKEVVLGTFESEADAARAYDSEAIMRFGDFARTNFTCGGPART